jgi:hypothetical protein
LAENINIVSDRAKSGLSSLGKRGAIAYNSNRKIAIKAPSPTERNVDIGGLGSNNPAAVGVSVEDPVLAWIS